LIQLVVRNRTVLRTRQKLGKYRIEKVLGEGGFAKVYQALDTIEGLRVALKIPNPAVLTPAVLEDFRKEVRITARLVHPNILGIKNAEFIDGHFVIAYPLGERTLGDRLQNRLSQTTVIHFTEQMTSAIAHAHSHRVIHCDVKPDNFILFPDHVLKLSDFGIAKIAYQTLRASGSGTVGYVAPEQAMGKPSFRSDVFSLGLILYRMLAGVLPEWPYTWPPPEFHRIRARVHPDMIELIRRAMDVDPRQRFADGEQMLRMFSRIKARTIRHARGQSAPTQVAVTRDWRTIRKRQFLRAYGQLLDTRYACSRCEGPVSEAMFACPWCGKDREQHDDTTQMPCSCPRCHRGLKSDWRFCPWCYGPGFEPATHREYSDVRYVGKCSNPRCGRKDLMPFMRYCPWCNRKVRRAWKIGEERETCHSCGWGVLSGYWSYCPWCGKPLVGR
jgi:eukaryotic-like serine/threonine-protein kinase